MTQEEKAKAYDEAIKKAKKELAACGSQDCDAARQIFRLFPELAKSEDKEKTIKLSEEEQNKFANVVLTSCALSFIKYLDAHKYEGKKCVSNGECEDIENAFHNAMWDRLHRYYYKYIENKGEQKEYTFKSLPRLLDMVEPTERAKAYCQKLVDALIKEGYATDAKIVGECLKQMNGEKVAMATMDEQK